MSLRLCLVGLLYEICPFLRRLIMLGQSIIYNECPKPADLPEALLFFILAKGDRTTNFDP